MSLMLSEVLVGTLLALGAFGLLYFGLWWGFRRDMKRLEEHSARQPDMDTYVAAFFDGDEKAEAEIEAWEDADPFGGYR